MVSVDNAPEAQAALALAHFFTGIVKADEGLQQNDVKKIHLIIYKMRHDLPGDYEKTTELMTRIMEDADYEGWNPDAHCDEGLKHFERFYTSGKCVPRHITGIFDLLEIIVEVGDVTEGEQTYIARINEEFNKRYADMRD
jgi:hypothetical protein